MLDFHSIESLEDALSKTGWNKARIRLLARFLIALIACRTVCLSQLANVLPRSRRSDKPSTHYKRLQRFLRHFDLTGAPLARLIVALARQEPPFVLALDRTHWRLGKTELNVLVLALVSRGVAFPLFWSVMHKAGNSNLAQRQALLRQYLSAFGQPSIDYLCADREFSGHAFARWLLAERVPFVLRLRGNIRMSNAQGQKCSARSLFASAKVHQVRDLGRREVFGRGGCNERERSLSLFVSGTRCEEGDFMILISDIEERENKEGALLERYRRRWGIETLFGCLKSRGFNLEATHVSVPERLSRLIGVLALAFCWAYGSGVWLFEQRPWKLKKHGRLMISLFRRGLDWLQRIYLPLCGNYSARDAQIAIRFLSCT